MILVIGETTYAIDEVYIASKKDDRLICKNQHDLLIATRKEVAEKLPAMTRYLPGII